MPCTLEPWEELWEERHKNRERFGLDVTDIGLLTGLLCETCTILEKDGYFLQDEDQSRELKLWWEAHKVLDQEQGTNQ